MLQGMSERQRHTPVRDDLERAVEYLKSVGCSEIFVFGSTARGDYEDDSDLDIAVRGIPADQFFAVYGELMTRLSRPVDLVDLDLQKRFGKQLLAGSELRRVG
jgi:predicted nucleotidyltransferase